MRRDFLLTAVATSLAACSAPTNDPRGSRVYEAYIAGQQGYTTRVNTVPELATQVESAKRIVATMPDGAIERLEALGYPLLAAADKETQNRRSWTSRGTDWTRYAEPHGGYRTSTESEIKAWRIATAQRAKAICDATEFRAVHGRMEKQGRQTQPETDVAIGIVPTGIHSYLSTLIADNGERLSVTWARRWQNNPGDPIAQDPLDDNARNFSLRRMPNAENWTVAGWSAEPLDYHDRATCISALTRS